MQQVVNGFFALLSRMRYIGRWGLMRSTVPENIQEHSHEVAVYAHALGLIRREIFHRRCDAERLAVGAAYGVELLSAAEWLVHSYPTHGDTLYERIHNNDAYGDIMAPKTIQARYMTEDVPNGLVPIAALGHAAGVDTPNIDAVITLACSIYDKDFRAEGRSLKNLGLEGMNKDEILHYFVTGMRETAE